MRCPKCGSMRHVESDTCTHEGGGGEGGILPAGNQRDRAAFGRSAGALREISRSGRRRALAGVLLLFLAGVILLALRSKGLPTFLALLWTCWIFFSGVIIAAEGGARWLSSSSRLYALARAFPDESKREDQAACQPATASVPDSECEGDAERPAPALLDKARPA